MKAPVYDTHTHTIYCGHADQNMRPLWMLEVASEKQLKFLTITEHLHEERHRHRIERIEQDLRRSDYPAPCPIYLGAEIDADPEAADGSLVAPTDGLAYVIASTHHYPDSRRWWYEAVDFTDAERTALIDRWFEWAKLIVANPAVDTFAHPGVLLSKNGNTESFGGGILDNFKELFKVAAEHKTNIELNELAAKKLSEAHQATYPALVAAAVEAGCSIIFASDAHQPEAIARFEWTLRVADEAGLKAKDLATPKWHAEPFLAPEK